MTARGDRLRCSRNPGSNYRTGLTHQGKTDLCADDAGIVYSTVSSRCRSARPVGNYREEYYHERLKAAEGSPAYQQWLAKLQSVAGKAEAIIGKQRHGPIGTIQLHFDAICTRFSSYANTERR